MIYKIVMAQVRSFVGDIAKNKAQCLYWCNKARDELQADIIVFPELYLSGYSPEDLLFRDDFIKKTEAALAELAQTIEGICCILGHPQRIDQQLYNAASVIDHGKIIGSYFKQCLPNDEVFDEQRYFTAGIDSTVINIRGLNLGILICEDIWHEAPLSKTVAQGAECCIILNASPFAINKSHQRQQLLSTQARRYHIPLLYTNRVGGQDSVVFDGGSMAVNAEGELCVQAPFFQEGLTLVQCAPQPLRTLNVIKQPIPPQLSTEENCYRALVSGIRDYVTGNGFHRIILGLSGGIDSALSVALAVDAIGAQSVTGILMPSRYTSALSQRLAMEQAGLLGIEYRIIPIDDPYQCFIDTLNQPLADITLQNLQARCRGVLLMALANETGAMVLTTGNRSELAVGYCTLYGDMAGGFCALSDVPKTQVYSLAHYRNSISYVIPAECITRAPSAELKSDQRDEDTLPPYDVLDAILYLYIDQEQSLDDIVAAGFARETVNKIIHLVKCSEFKRKQAPLGIRLHNKAFGKDRRYPTTCYFF